MQSDTIVVVIFFIIIMIIYHYDSCEPMPRIVQRVQHVANVAQVHYHLDEFHFFRI